jgi:cobalamin biosynthesis protein CbiG
MVAAGVAAAGVVVHGVASAIQHKKHEANENK